VEVVNLMSNLLDESDPDVRIPDSRIFYFFSNAPPAENFEWPYLYGSSDPLRI